MVRFIFLPLALLASLVFACEKEVTDLIAPVVLFQQHDGNEIPNNSLELPLGEEATFIILIEDESNIRDIRYLMSVNGGDDRPIDEPGFLQQLESSPLHKLMTAEIPFPEDAYTAGDNVRVTVKVNDPFGNATIHSLEIILTE